MAKGELTYRQLESLWLSAGGRRSLAPTMAAIGEAESGGEVDAHNPSGAEGPWQILGAVRPRDQAHLFNPKVNAEEAVLKEKTQGLSAWTTYTSGAYKKFLQGGSIPSGGGGGVKGGQGLLDEAEKFIGTPYVWGGESPKGFDCSGLVQYAAQKVGLKNVPRTSEAQYSYAQKISRKDLKPGDLVFYAGSDGTNADPGHVAIYAGGGSIIQAPHTGADVEKSPIDAGGKPAGYGRLPGIGGADFTGSAPGGGGGGTGPGGTGITTATLDSWPGSSWLNQIPGLNLITNLGDLGNIGGPLGSLANAVSRAEHGVEWFFVPNHWVRIICFMIGLPMVGLGVVTMVKGSTPVPVSAYGVSTTVSAGSIAPALGIVEVTAGAVLLFIAFHNLEAQNVNDFPGLISYLQGSLQRGGAQDTGTTADTGDPGETLT